MMDKIDFHLHAEFSYDSSIQSSELLPLAIQKSYSAIAFTEHLDLLPQELGYFGLKSLHQYIKQINNLKAMYPQIKVLCGIEIGDYHQVKDFALSLLNMYHFDLILGSVHFLSDHTNVAIKLPNALSPTQIEDYYRQNLSLVSTCQIDVLAHLGVYKRYYDTKPDESFCLPLLKEIFGIMIERKIALELNFSCFRKVYHRLLPEPEQIKLYHDMGGRLISIGSDSHQLEHFDDHYDEVIKVIREIGEFEVLEF